MSVMLMLSQNNKNDFYVLQSDVYLSETGYTTKKGFDLFFQTASLSLFPGLN